jgi:hypothetical protein
MSSESWNVDELVETGPLMPRVLCEGWVRSSVGGAVKDMRLIAGELAKQLGVPLSGRAGQTIEPLLPTKPTEAKPKSLSAIHGLGSFPMHTDGAHQIVPPRFVVLTCASSGTRPVPTNLLRFRDLGLGASELARFEAIPFLVRNGRRSFYSTICSVSRPFIRFDEGCMVPQDASGEASKRFIAQRARDVGFETVHWQTGDVLVIDNWNVMHGRGVGNGAASADRQLFRVNVQ